MPDYPTERYLTFDKSNVCPNRQVRKSRLGKVYVFQPGRNICYRLIIREVRGRFYVFQVNSKDKDFPSFQNLESLNGKSWKVYFLKV